MEFLKFTRKCKRWMLVLCIVVAALMSGGEWCLKCIDTHKVCTSYGHNWLIWNWPWLNVFGCHYLLLLFFKVWNVCNIYGMLCVSASGHRSLSLARLCSSTVCLLSLFSSSTRSGGARCRASGGDLAPERRWTREESMVAVVTLHEHWKHIAYISQVVYPNLHFFLFKDEPADNELNLAAFSRSDQYLQRHSSISSSSSATLRASGSTFLLPIVVGALRSTGLCLCACTEEDIEWFRCLS